MAASSLAPRRSPGEAATRDGHLLRRWRSGDADAGADLLHAYSAFIERTCRRLGVREDNEVLDIHQDLVLRLLDKLAILPELVQSSFAGYVAWQLRDLVKRRRLAASGRVDASLVPPQLSADHGPGVVAGDAIEQCSQRLPPRERQVFELRYRQGMSTKEVALAIESNENAVAQGVFGLSRGMRARLRLAGFDEFGEEA